MSAPVALRSAYGDLFGSSMLPVLEELFTSRLMQHPMQREKIMKVISHDRDIWQYSELHDLELATQIAEGSEYTFSRPKQGANKTLTIVKNGRGFSISEEMVDDGKFNHISEMVAMLAKSMRESQEVAGMNLLNNGFATETTADGQFIFDTDHSLPSGITFRNELSTSADLSVTSLDTALVDFETQFQGDSGILYNIKPRWLVVAPQNKRFAKELIGSELKADTSDNNLNSFKEDGIQVMSSPHLTDTDAWFLIASPESAAENGLRIIKRTGIETKFAGPDVGFKTDAIFYKARYREVVGAVHPYGLYGSPGA